MNIKKVISLAVLLGTVALMAQQAVTNNVATRRRKRKGTAPRGEMVLAPSSGPRLFIVNQQTRVTGKAVEDMRMSWHRNVWLHTDIVSGTREAALANEECGLALCVVDKPGNDMLLVSPEGRWAELNVAALAGDGADEVKLAARFKKEMWRALAYLIGVGNEKMPSLLTSINNLVELDANECTEPTPLAFNDIIYWAAKRKMARVRYTTYRQACREGWATAPTNDAQRAVWQEIKSDRERGPTNPIKIAPPAKK